MPSIRQWVWSDELVTLFEEASGAGNGAAPPPLIGYAVDEDVDIAAFANRIIGGDRDEPTGSGELVANP